MVEKERTLNSICTVMRIYSAHREWFAWMMSMSFLATHAGLWHLDTVCLSLTRFSWSCCKLQVSVSTIAKSHREPAIQSSDINILSKFRHSSCELLLPQCKYMPPPPPSVAPFRFLHGLQPCQSFLFCIFLSFFFTIPYFLFVSYSIDLVDSLFHGCRQT